MTAMQVLHISTFSPTQCGIATYTESLIEHLPNVHSHKLRIIYEGDAPCDGLFGTIPLQDLQAYRRFVRAINGSSLDVVSLQHEFGIFGGTYGEFVNELVDAIDKPIVVTLHTTSCRLSAQKQEILRHIILASRIVVVLSEESAKFIRTYFGIAIEKVKVIRHGVPELPFTFPEASIGRRQDAENLVIVSAGHIRPSKGYAIALSALAKLRDRGIPFSYILLGKSQPQWDISGEWEQGLENLIRKFRLENHVEWQRRYLDAPELFRWIQTADLGLVPYTESDQISSGILPMMPACGRPVLATAFDYAKSISCSAPGVILTEMNDPDRLYARLLEISTRRDWLRAIMQTCYSQTRPWLWRHSAAQYRDAFQSVL
jgi:glycosyltransferase involved in cell wall biosynthesis